MLDHLRQRVLEALASAKSATLSTYGAAALQAALLPCEALDLRLYFLLPTTSDHLLNLESHPDVVVTTVDWQLRGTAVLVNVTSCPPNLCLLQKPEVRWSRLVEVRPSQLNIRRRNGWGFSETIDIED